MSPVISLRGFYDDKEHTHTKEIQQCNRKANTISGFVNNMAACTCFYILYIKVDVPAHSSQFFVSLMQILTNDTSTSPCLAGHTATRPPYYVHSINV